MFIVANFIDAVAQIIGMILTIYMWIVIIRALISWVNPDPYNPVVQILYKLTEPVLFPIRRLIGTFGMGIDLSPLVLILIIIFLQSFLVMSLRQLARQLM